MAARKDFMAQILEMILNKGKGSLHGGGLQKETLADLSHLNDAYRRNSLFIPEHAIFSRFEKNGWSPERIAESYMALMNESATRGVPNFSGGIRKGTEALWLENGPTSLFSPVIPHSKGTMALTIMEPSTARIKRNLEELGWAPGERRFSPCDVTPAHIGSRSANSLRSGAEQFSAVGSPPTLTEILGSIFDKVKLGKKVLPFAVGGAAGAGALGAASEASANTSGNSAGSRSDWLSGLMSGWTPNSASARASVSTPSRLSDRLPTNVPPLTFGSVSGSSLGAASEASPEGFRVPRSQADLRGNGALPISSLHRNVSYGGTGSQLPRLSAVKGQPELNEILGPIFEQVKLGKNALPFAVGGAAGTGALGAASVASANLSGSTSGSSSGSSAGGTSGSEWDWLADWVPDWVPDWMPVNVPSIPGSTPPKKRPLTWDEWVASDRTTPEPALESPDPFAYLIPGGVGVKAGLRGLRGLANYTGAVTQDAALSLALDAILEGNENGLDYTRFTPQMPGAWF